MYVCIVFVVKFQMYRTYACLVISTFFENKYQKLPASAKNLRRIVSNVDLVTFIKTSITFLL